MDCTTICALVWTVDLMGRRAGLAGHIYDWLLDADNIACFDDSGDGSDLWLNSFRWHVWLRRVRLAKSPLHDEVDFRALRGKMF
ncbi:hypothetical protein ACLOJK_011742 [Asimina triloba]